MYKTEYVKWLDFTNLFIYSNTVIIEILTKLAYTIENLYLGGLL